MYPFTISSFFNFIKVFLIATVFVQLNSSDTEIPKQGDESSPPNPIEDESLNTCPADSREISSSTYENTGGLTKDQQVKIIGGKRARPGQFPYQVYLNIQSLEGFLHICGGSIIHPEYILTAAQCVERASNPLDINITAGEIRPEIFPCQGQRRRAIQVIIHEEYDQVRYMENNLALIKVDVPFIFTTRLVQPISLPPAFYAAEGRATASGFGSTMWSVGVSHPPSDVLLYVDNLNIIPDYICQLFSLTYAIQESNICTFKTGEDVCFGDTGGPLTCEDKDGSIFLCGVISSRIHDGHHQCAQHGHPGIYSEVSYFISWIQGFVPY